MKFVDEFRSPALAARLSARLQGLAGQPLAVMEFCGTHTMAIARYGLRTVLPARFRLISGPGCPVCVTPPGYIDAAADLSRDKAVIVATFGDMLRIPGTEGSLLQARSAGRDIRVVYSPLDAVRLAQDNPCKHIVFLGVGFEATAPVVGLAILEAARLGLNNYSVFSALKLVAPVLHLLTTGLKLQGLLCPGHIAAVTGLEPFRLAAEHANLPAVVAGFELLDILQAFIMLDRLAEQGRPELVNQYPRVVRAEGNAAARAVLRRVFYPEASWWRGLGRIAQAGLAIQSEYCRYDAGKIFGLPAITDTETAGCYCSDILTGRKIPPECALFKTKCTPEQPQGACMVSGEGACSAYYRYG